jgi:hypothetical protein
MSSKVAEKTLCLCATEKNPERADALSAKLETRIEVGAGGTADE